MHAIVTYRGIQTFTHPQINRLSFSETASTAGNFLARMSHCLSSTIYTKFKAITQAHIDFGLQAF